MNNREFGIPPKDEDYDCEPDEDEEPNIYNDVVGGPLADSKI